MAFYGLLFFVDLRGYVMYELLCTYLLSITPGDVKEKTIPDLTTLIFFIAFVVFRISALDLMYFLSGCGGLVFSLLLFGIPYLIRRDWIGGGDIKTAAACGMLLGFTDNMTFLFRAAVVILVFYVIRLIFRRKNLRDPLPFAPFLLIAALI